MSLIRGNLRNIALFLLVFSIPFDTKKFIWSATPVVSEYFSVFLYGTDILLLFLLVFWGFRAIDRRDKYLKILAAFSLLAALPVIWAVSPLLAFYGWIRLLLLLAFALALSGFLRRGNVALGTIFSAVFASAVFQSIVALLQFRDQTSLGLKWLGESVIGLTTPGIARVATNGLAYLRSYGTMPHANILAAFLGFGLVAAIYLLYRAKRPWSRIGFASGLFFILAGLIFTFSRSGWIVAGFTVATLVVYGLWRSDLRRRATAVVFVLVAAAAFLVPSGGRLMFARAGFTATEPSVVDRVIYNEIGLFKFPETYPLGVGLKNQVLVAERNGWYRDFGLKYSFQAQPIHDIYLLALADTGILGLAAFLAFIGWLTYDKFRIWLKTKDADVSFALVLVLGALAFGLVDHFYWDLWSGQLMFWLALGILMGIGPRSPMDRISPSEGEGAGSIPAEGTK